VSLCTSACVHNPLSMPAVEPKFKSPKRRKAEEAVAMSAFREVDSVLPAVPVGGVALAIAALGWQARAKIVGTVLLMVTLPLSWSVKDAPESMGLKRPPALPRRHRRGHLQVRGFRTGVGNPDCRLAIHGRSFSRVGPGMCVRVLRRPHSPARLVPRGERENHKGRRKTLTHI
jgi:hypothetical protein